MAVLTANTADFQSFIIEAKCCNAQLGASYFDAMEMASVDTDCILPKWRKLTAFINSIEDYTVEDTAYCLTAAQVQVIIDKIKQICQICEGCGEYAKTALPDPIPENFDVYIVTDNNSYIIDDLGNRIIV